MRQQNPTPKLFSLKSKVQHLKSVLIPPPSSKNHPKTRTRLLLAVCILIILTPLAIYLARTPNFARADWYDDAYRYRIPITFGNTGSEDYDKRVLFKIDTETLIDEDKMQATCADIRFTDASGTLLPHFLDSASVGCDNPESEYWVLLPTIYTGTNTVYIYYGSPYASDIGNAIQFSQSAFSPTSGPFIGSEQVGSVPAGFWRFDYGHGNISYDLSPNQNHATVGKLPTVALEQQIFIVANSQANTNTSYIGSPTGKVKWTAASYPNSTVYFEALIRNNGGHTTTAGLLDDATNTLVTNSEVTTTSATYTLVRSSAITLTDNTVYYPQVKTSNSAGTAQILFARLIVLQSAPAKLTATETHIEVARSGDQNGTDSYAIHTGQTHYVTYRYQASAWNPTPTVYFDVTLNGTQAGDTNYAALFEKSATCTTQVSGSEVSTSGTNRVHTRSSAITLEDGKEYMVCLKRVGTGTVSIQRGSLVFVQSDPSGIQSLQLHHQLDVTKFQLTNTAYENQLTLLTYEPANFSGGTFSRFFQASAATGSNANGYLQLYNVTGSSAITNSELHFTTTVPTFKNSPSLDSNLPTSTATLDVQAKVDTSQNISYHVPRLVTTVTELMTPEAHTRPAWQSEDTCISGKCVWFDGTDHVLTIPNSPPINLDSGLKNGFTYQTWVRPNSLGGNNSGYVFWKGTNTYLKLAAGSNSSLANLEASVNLATTNATLTLTDALTLNRWHHLALTYTSSGNILSLYVDGVKRSESTNGSGALSADTEHLLLGGPDDYHFHGFMDEFKIYPYARTQDHLKPDLIKGAPFRGASAVFGASQSFLSDGLVGYWKMDETSGNANDSSGNSNTLTNNGTTPFNAGRFGNAPSFNGSSRYFSASSTVSDVKTISFWAKPVSTTDNYLHLAGGIYLSSSGTLSASGFTDPKIYVNGTASATVTADVWQHITVTTDTAVSASVFEVGRANGSYAINNSQIDEVRIYNRALSPDEVQGLYRYAPGPIAHWKFDESSGNAQDSTIYANHLSNINQVTYVPGKFGNAARFESTAAMYQYVGTNSYLALSGSFSISAWVKPDSTTAATQYNIAGKWDNEHTSYQLAQYADQLRLYLNDEDTYVTTTTANLQVGKWYHVQGDYDAANQSVALYVNGIPQASTTTGTIPSSIVNNASRFHVSGQDSTSIGGSLDVKIAASADDAHQTAAGGVNVTGQNLNMHSSATATTRSFGGMRWQLNIPQGTTIQSAYLKGLTTANDDPYLTIHAQAADTAAAFTTTSNDITNRARTTAGVLWDETDLGSPVIVTSPDISEVIQEVIDRPGWEANNYLALITVPFDDTERLFTFRPYDNTTTNQPNLVLEFEQADTKHYYDGLIDDVKIYNYTRTLAQVVQDMNAGHPIPGSPVGSASIHYKFDEGYGDTANNSGSGGSALNATITSGTWTNEGKFNKALEFTASTQVTTTITDPGNTNTISVWVYPTTSAASKTLVTASRLTTDASSRPIFGGCTGTALPLDTWTHIVAVSNGASSCTLYQNGVQTATGTTGVSFGTSLNLGGSSFTGRLDEFKLYYLAMTADQVATEHNQGKAQSLGAVGTTSTGAVSNAASSEYCPPGQSTACVGPLGEWKLDENQGIYAYDTSDNDSTGTLNNSPLWVPGKNGSALSFNGTNNYVSIPHSTLLNLGATTDSYTISFWAYFNEKHFATLVKKGQEGWGDGKAPFAFYTGSTGATSINFLIHDGTNGQTVTLTSYNAGEWIHLTGVRDVAADKIRLYHNGRLVEEETDPTTTTMQRSTDIMIGKNGIVSDSYLNGKIDELKIYDYARTPEQIAWDYNRGQPQWNLKLNQASGTTAYDSGPRARNGTLQGNAVFNTTAGECQEGNCVSLDGTDDYILVSATTLLTFSGASTNKASWGGWYYLTTSGANKALLEKANEIKLTTDSNSKPVCDIYTSSAYTTNSASAANQVLALNQWNHILCTYDGTTIKLYLNGILSDSWNQTASVTTVSSATYVGSSATGTGDVEGRIDEQYIYNYALTPQQIQALINQGAVHFAP